MVALTPFHERVEQLNQTGLYSHWAGFLVAEKYQMSEKFEYFAVRNAAGVFDTSPLFKYRIAGRDAEAFLAGVLVRDIRRCRPGRAQYTMWCDDGGAVVEDGVVYRVSGDEFLLTSAGRNLAYLQSLVGYERVEIEDVSDDLAAMAVQGPGSRRILAALAPEVADLAFFGHTELKLADTAVMVSRTGFTGDLGYEIWIPAPQALAVWDAVMAAGAGQGLLPFGQIALLMARIEAGLLLIGTDFESSRFAHTPEQRSSPIELGYGWMLRGLDETRPFVGKQALMRELAEQSSRFRVIGIEVDWRAWDDAHDGAGLIAPKDHTPVQSQMMLYDRGGERAGYATSFMYSPLVQRHIAIARVRPELAAPGSVVQLEYTINHEYRLIPATVTRLPFYDPERRTA